MSLKRAVLLGTVAIMLALLGALFFSLPKLSPPLALASSTTLSTLGGQVLYRGANQGSFSEARDGMTLSAGDSVKTSADSRALVTFFEGTTLSLEPETEVVIKRLDSAQDSPATFISFRLEAGKIWSRVVDLADPSSRFEIETPSAVALVRGTLIGAKLDPDKTFTCWVFEGQAVVTAQGQDVVLRPGQETTVRPGEAPTPAAARPLPSGIMRIRTQGSVFPRLVDSFGRSVGFAAPGVVVNQLLNSITSRAFDEPLFIDVPNPIPGDYILLLEGWGEGEFRLRVTGVSLDNVIFDREVTGTIGTGQILQLPLTVQIEERLLKTISLGGHSPLSGPTPGKVVLTALEASRVAPKATELVVAERAGKAESFRAALGTPIPTLPAGKATPRPDEY